MQRKNCGKKKCLFFIHNLYRIQVFLSLLQRENDNILYTGSTDDQGISKLANSLLPDLRTEKLPDCLIAHSCLQDVLLVKRKYFWKLAFRLLALRVLSMRFRAVDARNTEAYLFSRGITFHFFIPLNRLKRQGVKIRFFDLMQGRYNVETVPSSSHSRMFSFSLRILEMISGLKLELKQTLNWQQLNWAPDDQIVHEKERPTNWGELSQKFSLPSLDTKNAVLFLDDLLEAHPGVNIEKTKQNFVRFFEGLIKEGKKIHLKPHYTCADRKSLWWTHLIEQITVLPEFYPAEYFMTFYDEIYFIASGAASFPTQGKKISVKSLLAFDEEKARQRMDELFRQTASVEVAKIHIL